MTEYAVSRVATRNPEINGRTLYLTNIGFWTLNPKHAWSFKTQAEANVEAARWSRPGDVCNVVEIET